MYNQDMARKHRFQILLTEEEAQILKSAADARDIPQAELIRDFIKSLRNQNQPPLKP